jgi:predicted pyridoxine 5'-phosphate oxidase superfamily flavin-nucleotide-binding protein
MSSRFLQIASTPSVQAAQSANGSRVIATEELDLFKGLDAHARDFIAARDSFYMASVSETGWPYMQHRGGPVGFLRVLDDRTLGFADFRGNRQYISLGNTAANDRVALFLMDYPNRTRLKIYAHAEAIDLAAEPDLAERLVQPGYRGRPERAWRLHVEATDWNCPQHITPRFTEVEIAAAIQPMRDRLVALEAENEALRKEIAT